jgi:hypothetical protein
MGRKVDVDDLVSAHEIADRLHVGRPSVVHDWRYRALEFPAPVTVLGSVLVWLWPDVEAWARETGRID